MSTDRRELTILAFWDAIKTIPDVTHIRNLDRELDREEYPAMNLMDGAEQPDRSLSMMGIRVLNMAVSVEIYVRTDGPNVGPALNEALAKLKAAVFTDFTLGGLAWRVDYEGMDDPVMSTEGSGDIPRASAEVGFIIVRQEAELDPYSHG